MSRKKELKALYEGMLFPRMIEEKMLKLLRQGKISKWFSGIGQEAIATGATLALKESDYILPMHRNLGVFTNRKIPLEKLLKQWRGDEDGFTNGRDRSFHFGTLDYNIIGMISHLAAQLSVGTGLALANSLSDNKKIVLAFTGEGGTSQGEFHEALNVAAVWKLPIIFLVENNGYALSTPSSEQFAMSSFTDKGVGYGMESVSVDGNNVVEVYSTIQRLANEIRLRPKPVLVEANTFRVRGHEEASGVKYVPKELIAKWKKRDPLKSFEDALLSNKVLDKNDISELRLQNKIKIEGAVKEIYGSAPPQRTLSVEHEKESVFHELTEPVTQLIAGSKKEMRFCDAITDGLRNVLLQFGNTIFMGQDIADYGGVFKITEGFLEEFGKDRIRNTPLCESAILGSALGLSLGGYKSMVEMQFSDFVSCGFNQIVNNIAKVKYRWNGSADVVIRMPAGGGVAAGPFHSQSMEAWFAHVPGLKIAYPSTPSDAKGLIIRSFEDKNPVLFFEHKALYRSVKEEVYVDYYSIPFGKARIANEGDEISVISYGLGVQIMQEVIAENENLSIELIDLRTIIPWDKDAVRESVTKTGKVLILHEASLTGGFGGEICAWIAENLFDKLDAPPMRHAALDTPVPFHESLEKQYFSKSELLIKLQSLADF